MAARRARPAAHRSARAWVIASPAGNRLAIALIVAVLAAAALTSGCTISNPDDPDWDNYRTLRSFGYDGR